MLLHDLCHRTCVWYTSISIWARFISLATVKMISLPLQTWHWHTHRSWAVVFWYDLQAFWTCIKYSLQAGKLRLLAVFHSPCIVYTCSSPCSASVWVPCRVWSFKGSCWLGLHSPSNRKAILWPGSYSARVQCIMPVCMHIIAHLLFKDLSYLQTLYSLSYGIFCIHLCKLWEPKHTTDYGLLANRRLYRLSAHQPDKLLASYRNSTAMHHHVMDPARK